MTVEEISERIINGQSSEISLSQEDEDSSNDFAHYGVLGMKWGVRKDRQRKGESDQQYKDRMDRQSRERIAAADRKAKAKEQKRQIKAQERDKRRTLRSQERLEKARLKSQLKNKEAEIEAQEKQRAELRKDLEKQQKAKDKVSNKRSSKKKGTPVELMTDEELRSAINRINLEKQYKDAGKKKSGALSKAAKAVIIPVGLAVLKGRLTKIANKAIDDVEAKYQAKKGKQIISDVVKTVSTNTSPNINKTIGEILSASYDEFPNGSDRNKTK